MEGRQIRLAGNRWVHPGTIAGAGGTAGSTALPSARNAVPGWPCSIRNAAMGEATRQLRGHRPSRQVAFRRQDRNEDFL